MIFMIGAFILNVVFFFYNLLYNKRVTRLLGTCEDIIEVYKDG